MTLKGPPMRRLAILALLPLAACIRVPNDVQIGDPQPPVTYDPVIAAACTDITGHYHFRWYGLASHLPPFCISVGPADTTTPVLQRGSK